MSDKIGKLKDYQVKLHIDLSVVPRRQPHRRLPYHLVKAVDAELDALIGNPIEFTGDARQQVARVVSRIGAITSAHPAAAQYKPGSIR